MHDNPTRIDGDVLIVDRKFHSGMGAFVETLGEPILSVHPEAPPDYTTMDAIEVPVSQLSYRVMPLKTHRSTRTLLPIEMVRLREEIARSKLMYGASLGSARLARSLRVPYIMVVECDLWTQIILETSTTLNPFRKAARAFRRVVNYVGRTVPDMLGAYSVHCNGYPVYDEARWFNANRLLYLDSRTFADQVISAERLRQRLASREGRPIRLLFSGRYEPMKGASDAVRVALECGNRGLAVEMHCFGQGSLYSEMTRLASLARDPVHIQIHDSIPYPELIRVSQTFDLFVCCHIQSDPSCTYLESFGAGLPIVGYANRMWRRLSEESGVGGYSKIGQPGAVAENIQTLCSDPQAFNDMSERARRFAADHCFEQEFRLRTSAIVAALARCDTLSIGRHI